MLRTVGAAIKTVQPTADIVTAGLPDSRLSKPNLYKYELLATSKTSTMEKELKTWGDQGFEAMAMSFRG